jgi:Xaa-Pro dipeptidase
MSEKRLSRLYALLEDAQLDAVALNPGATLTYLTGLNFHLSERPTVLLAARGAAPALILPDLEFSKASLSSIPLECFSYNDDPVSWQNAFKEAAKALPLKHAKIGVEPTHLRILELNHLQAALPDAKLTPAESSLGILRIHKDKDEVEAMRAAARIAQEALLAILPLIGPGLSEQAIAAELTIQLLRAGAQPDLPFTPIVASGPNSANPHATPGERRLQSGDLILIDWGAAVNGYCSDITRTFVIGKTDPEMGKIARVVLEANQAGFAAAMPGAPAAAVDQAARSVIDSAGYGAFFTHRTGHGLGMEGHEAPYIYDGSAVTLQPGMTFTIEPGIYLPGRGGVRIEDDIVITESGAEQLTDLPRELQIIS